MTAALAVRLGMARAQIAAATAAGDGAALLRAAGVLEGLGSELAQVARPDAAVRRGVDDLMLAIHAAEATLAPVMAEQAARVSRDRRLRGAYRGGV
jgi:hypothetical protein